MFSNLKSLYNRCADAALTPIQKAHIALQGGSTQPHYRTATQTVVATALVIGTSVAFAGTDEGFKDFREAIEDLAGGNFAIGISILALILGALLALGKMTVWPALMGLGIAAVFAIGPYMIVQVFDWFNLDPGSIE